MEFHEVATIFPMMGEEEYQRLVTSLKENGLREPIWVHEGKIIDGRNRYKACLEAGVEPTFREWDGEGSLVQFVVDLNLSRRHLTPTQKAVSALEIEEQLAKEAETRVGGRPSKIHALRAECEDTAKLVSNLTPVFGKSADHAAKITGGSGGYVREAKRIINQDPQLKEPMKSGMMNLQDAKRVVKLPEDERQDIVQRIVSGTSKNVRRAKSSIIREKRAQLYSQTVIEPDNYTTYHCSISQFKGKVKEGSLDAIITDPPYSQRDLPVYTDLGDFAAHALKPGGSLIVMIGKYYLPEIIHMLCQHLNYHWMACYAVRGDTSKNYQRHIGISWKPLLWFVKGEYTGPWVNDMLESKDIPLFMGEKKDKDYHDWGQPVPDMEAIIEWFTFPGQLICDPFVGGGATAVAALYRKRHFVGCDIKEECVLQTRQRIKDALALSNDEDVA